MNKPWRLFSAVAYPLLALLLLAGLVGCKTIITCVQNEATFSENGKSLGPSPVTIVCDLDDKRVITVSKPGYANKEITVTFDSPNKINVSLDRLFNVKSTPSGADIYVNGSMVGTTPAENIAINDSGSSTIQLRKKGWFDTARKPIKIDTPVDISMTMDRVPGSRFLELIPTSDGVTINDEWIFSDTDIGEHSPNVASCKKLTNQPETEYILSFSLLPDGKTLVTSILEEYTKNEKTDYRANIWQLDTSIPGAPRKAITGGDYFDLQPTPSSDGETLYFSSSRNGILGIWNLDLNNRDRLRTLTYMNFPTCSPSLKPNTDLLFFTAVLPDKSVPPYIWKKLSSDGMPEQVTEGRDAQWNPDGTKFLYIKGSLKENKARIWVCDPDGKNSIQVSPGDGDFNDIDARWSPDGKKIIFASDRSIVKGAHNYDIYIMDADGGNLTQLTTNICRDDNPIILPDGETVFFRSNRGLSWDIWTIKIKTGEQQTDR